MTIEKNTHGALVISAVIGGYLITRQYYGYTKREAARLFRSEVRGAK